MKKHIKPLLGPRTVRNLALSGVEKMQADIAAGKTAKGPRKARGGQTTGGASATARTVSTPRVILGHAHRLKLIETNPWGVRQIASQRRERHLGFEELQTLGKAMRVCTAEGEHPKGIAAARVILMTGFRRLEALGLHHPWVSRGEQCVRFPDTKTGAQIRPSGAMPGSSADYGAARPSDFM